MLQLNKKQPNIKNKKKLGEENKIGLLSLGFLSFCFMLSDIGTFFCGKKRVVEGAQTINNFFVVFIFYVASFVIWGKSFNFSMFQIFIGYNKIFA